ncbi:hypothetical protein FACS189460_1050 [Deltaproteobacteria bacterium]|nr:hypothetical protein FACS189460_1050 [Deltaproteobacteria bacterium]
MTDQSADGTAANGTANGGTAARRLLAPCLWPRSPAGIPAGPLFYLSWPGWEQYLARRLGLAPVPGGPAPLLLPAESGEPDLAALDQLVSQAGTLGAGLLNLLNPPSGPTALASAIRRRAPAAAQPSEPLLSDRAYLALWSLTEYQAARGDELLAEAARKERAMWAALRGEPAAEPPPPSGPPAGEPDRRAAYAWRCWRRLAALVLRPDDRLIPTVPEPEV